ncbi:MAG: valine--tRNA ligase [Actinomycetota bacterium]|nr:valine--tRNA ligase [Actinomycetota bacterium]
MVGPPEKPSLVDLEDKWDAVWEEQQTYRFDRTKTRADVYSIDTPPPTVSGQLHIGSVFGYVQVDSLARFQRMRGREVFYPMGWDDNGLPTERRVQNHHGVRCDPTVPYDPDLALPEPVKGKPQLPISRRNFVELCHERTLVDEKAFEQVWRRVGLSVDWTLTYATIDEHCRRVAQRAFLRNVQRGEAYAAEAPTLWDIDFRTAVAQAELEDREVDATSHRLLFGRPDGGHVEIETTRPELLPACVALVAHPDDPRYRPLFGTEVTTPLFGVSVPVVAHPLAAPDKGTGIAMVCTFGDTTDVVWWRELDLALRSVVRRDGRFQTETPGWLAGAGAVAWAELAGKTAKQARARIVDLLRDVDGMLGEPRAIRHAVKFYEKGDRPLEIVTSRQWYIRNGARDRDLREALLERGRELTWYPDHMRVRYEHWVNGLNNDWLISRQRFFGVPFPVWYPVDADGDPVWDKPMVCDEAALPVDPQGEPPPGYDESQRGQPGGFVGDPDVMDTWATSSLSPQIVCGWEDDPDLFARTFPMDLRPQGPEIIRTWLFATVLRAHLEHAELPWANTSINGWILDPDRKKMAKSKGNVIEPAQLQEQYGADGLRYWACSGGPGTDTAVDLAQMKVGRRLANKVLNASRFVLGLAGSAPAPPAVASAAPAAGDSAAPTAGTADAAAQGKVSVELDRAVLALLADVVDSATTAFEDYQYHRALEHTEKFFWRFCDDYLELVKGRAYGQGPESESARTALSLALDTFLRLFAPFLPFVTEEVWSWWRPGSVHRAEWPSSAPLRSVAGPADPQVLDTVSTVLAEVRKAKSSSQVSLRAEVSRLTVTGNAARLTAIEAARPDLIVAGVVADLVLHESAEESVTVELAALV